MSESNYFSSLPSNFFVSEDIKDILDTNSLQENIENIQIVEINNVKFIIDNNVIFGNLVKIFKDKTYLKIVSRLLFDDAVKLLNCSQIGLEVESFNKKTYLEYVKIENITKDICFATVKLKIIY